MDPNIVERERNSKKFTPGISPTMASELELKLLNDYQKNFPLVEHPFASIAQECGVDESVVIECYQKLIDENKISRIGPIFAPGKAGFSTLAAMSVPQEKIEDIAEIVNSFPEVNHNYEREDSMNLWFVATAPSKEKLEKCLEEISQLTGYPVYDLRLEREFRIDLAFDLKGSGQ